MHDPLRPLRRLMTPVAYLIGRLGIGLLVSIACLWAFGSIVEDLLEKEPIRFDQWLAVSLHSAATPLATTVFALVTLLGSQAIVAVGALLAVYFVWRREWLNLAVWAVALAGGELLNLLLKLLFARPRPVFSVPLAVAQSYSFPSGHAMMSIIAYGLLAYFAVGAVDARRWRLIVAALAAFLVVAIGFSRLYLGVHYFTDVIGGFAAGWVWLSTCVWALRYGRDRLGQKLDRAPPTAV